MSNDRYFDSLLRGPRSMITNQRERDLAIREIELFEECLSHGNGEDLTIIDNKIRKIIDNLQSKVSEFDKSES